MTTNYKLVSAIIPLVFGVDRSTALTNTAVDIALWNGQNEFGGEQGFTMPVPGAIVAMSGSRETGHATIYLTAKANINGTASAVAVMTWGLGTGVYQAYETFFPTEVELAQGDVVGCEFLTDDGTGFAPNNVTITIFVQIGQSGS